LRSEYRGRHGHPTIENVGGRKQTVWAPNDFTFGQKEAMDWLTVWQKRIDAKIASE
jgi:hypothetical protein